MKRYSLVSEAHQWVKDRLCVGNSAIDATVGNGFDTLLLAGQVGINGKVFGFDIQESALDSAQTKFQQLGFEGCISLFHASHADMAQYIPVQCHGKINAIMFNLGYLPRGDKTIITAASSTIIALGVATKLLSVKGILTVIAYPGHEGGEIETEHIKQWLGQLEKERFTSRMIVSNDFYSSAPILFAIYKDC